MTITCSTTPSNSDSDTYHLVDELNHKLDLTVQTVQALVSYLDELAARAQVLESLPPFVESGDNTATDNPQWGATARRCLTDLRDARVAASHVDAPLRTLAQHVARLRDLTTQRTPDPTPAVGPATLRLFRVTS